MTKKYVFMKLVRYENCVIFWNNCSFYIISFSKIPNIIVILCIYRWSCMLLTWYSSSMTQSSQIYCHLSATGILGEIIFLFFFAFYILQTVCDVYCISHDCHILSFALNLWEGFICVLVFMFCYLFSPFHQFQDVVNEII